MLPAVLKARQQIERINEAFKRHMETSKHIDNGTYLQ